MGGWLKTPKAINRKEIPVAERIVYSVLLDACRDVEYHRTSVRELAKTCGLSHPITTRAIYGLEHKHMIQVTERHRTSETGKVIHLESDYEALEESTWVVDGSKPATRQISVVGEKGRTMVIHLTKETPVECTDSKGGGPLESVHTCIESKGGGPLESGRALTYNTRKKNQEGEVADLQTEKFITEFKTLFKSLRGVPYALRRGDRSVVFSLVSELSASGVADPPACLLGASRFLLADPFHRKNADLAYLTKHFNRLSGESGTGDRKPIYDHLDLEDSRPTPPPQKENRMGAWA